MACAVSDRTVSLRPTAIGLTASILIHFLVIFPLLVRYLEDQIQPPALVKNISHWVLRPSVPKLETSARVGARANRPAETLPAPVFRRRKRRVLAPPDPQPAVKEVAAHNSLPVLDKATPKPKAEPTPYPTSAKKGHKSQSDPAPGGAPAPESAAAGSADVGEGDLSPPVMLKGPQQIPVPATLRRHGGRFLISLKCSVAVDGSSQVSVLDGTGSYDLDQALQSSFSNLPWYPAESHGVPVAISVRLVIEAHWETGADTIEWSGLRPRPMQ